MIRLLTVALVAVSAMTVGCRSDKKHDVHGTPRDDNYRQHDKNRDGNYNSNHDRDHNHNSHHDGNRNTYRDRD